MDTIYGFDPVWRKDARILVLGSMPSVMSIERGFYYAHPRNAFWRVMSQTLGVTEPFTIEDKTEMLLNAGIALWDVARSCVRTGSLDSNIRDVTPNDINALVARCPDIRRILFNGQKAGEMYRRFFGAARDGICFTLPSTSPAYTLRFEKKLEAWQNAITLEEYNERR